MADVDPETLQAFARVADTEDGRTVLRHFMDESGYFKPIGCMRSDGEVAVQSTMYDLAMRNMWQKVRDQKLIPDDLRVKIENERPLTAAQKKAQKELEEWTKQQQEHQQDQQQQQIPPSHKIQERQRVKADLDQQWLEAQRQVDSKQMTEAER